MGAWNSAAAPKRMSFEAADISLPFLFCSDCVLWVKWCAGGAQSLWVTSMEEDGGNWYERKKERVL